MFDLRKTITVLCVIIAFAARADDLGTVRERFVDAVCPSTNALSKPIIESATELANSIQADGSWKDIDYTDQARSVWLTSKHVNNLLLMAKANHVAPDPKVKAALVSGIEWWLKNDPHNPNWWWNEIGIPQLLGETAMIMGDDLSDDQRVRVIAIVKRSVWTKWTGQNLVWGCGNQVVRGVLERNERTVADAYKRMYEEIRVEKPQGEGIMADASFHQHGAQFYSGGYGLAFANDIGRFVAYSWRTKFQIPHQQLDIYSRFILDGEQWMIRGTTFDYSATGREITRKGKSAVPRNWNAGPVTPVGAAYGLGNTMSRLAEFDVPRRDEYAQFAARLNGDDSAKPLSGNRYYWCSDYMSHQRPDFMISVRMFSSRLLNTELVNDEGKKSHHLADGCTFIYRTGDEYRDIFPVWDWNKVPGTTAEQIDFAANKKPGMKGQSDFVGGVSNGFDGAAAQDLIHGPLKARKFWMLSGSGMIALGAGINCDSENDVVTCIDQRLENGRHEKSADFAWHDGITYWAPGKQKLECTVGPQTGSWAEIGTGSSDRVTSNVFKLWIDHGVRPKDASYAYYVLLSGSASDSIVKVLSNTAEVQAAINDQDDLMGAVFWKPGSLEGLGYGKIEVDQPCLLLVSSAALPNADGKFPMKVSVSNPRNQPLTVAVRIGEHRLKFDLPGGLVAGSTVTQDVK
jgi:chondroitin AC lyase